MIVILNYVKKCSVMYKRKTKSSITQNALIYVFRIHFERFVLGIDLCLTNDTYELHIETHTHTYSHTHSQHA